MKDKNIGMLLSYGYLPGYVLRRTKIKVPEEVAHLVPNHVTMKVGFNHCRVKQNGRTSLTGCVDVYLAPCNGAGGKGPLHIGSLGYSGFTDLSQAVQHAKRIARNEPLLSDMIADYVGAKD